VTVAVVVECVSCNAANDASATRCGECGRPLGELHAPAQHPRITHPVVDCTCGGQGLCTACVLYLLDNNLPLDGSRWE
jgi:hypothetical protein